MSEEFVNNSDGGGVSATPPPPGFVVQPQPQPVYVPQQTVSGTAYAQPVYAQPQPVYAQPQPTYVQQQPVYVQPQQAQTYVVQQPVVQQVQSPMPVYFRVVNRGPLPRNLSVTGMQITLGIFIVFAFIGGCLGCAATFGGYGYGGYFGGYGYGGYGGYYSDPLYGLIVLTISAIGLPAIVLSCLAATIGFIYAILAAIVWFGCPADKPDWPVVSRLSLTALAFSLVVSVCLSVGVSNASGELFLCSIFGVLALALSGFIGLAKAKKWQ